MKKLMISFLTSAILIGVGMGITFLEFSDWSSSDYPKYLETLDSQTYESEEPIDMGSEDGLDEIAVVLNTMYRNEFRKIDMVDVVEDPMYTDSIKLEIVYKGMAPEIHTYTFETVDSATEPLVDEAEEVVYKGQLVIYTDLYDSIAEYKQVIEAMFDEKTIYKNMDNCIIEAVTVRTAYPEKIVVR